MAETFAISAQIFKFIPPVNRSPFEHTVKYLACCHKKKNFFSSVESKEALSRFGGIGGKSYYIGREGIEFYPQELMVFKKSDLPVIEGCTCASGKRIKTFG